MELQADLFVVGSHYAVLEETGWRLDRPQLLGLLQPLLLSLGFSCARHFKYLLRIPASTLAPAHWGGVSSPAPEFGLQRKPAAGLYPENRNRGAKDDRWDEKLLLAGTCQLAGGTGIGVIRA